MSVWICDVGNTRIKLAEFASNANPQSDPVRVMAWPIHEALDDGSGLDQMVGSMPNILVTGSGDMEPWIQRWPQSLAWTNGMDSPLRTMVKSGLGTDRAANAFAVQANCIPDVLPTESWLIVDAGTCVTCDLWHEEKHHGGAIAPGGSLRLTSMNSGTARLPEVSPSSIPPQGGLGTTTVEAMLGGAWHGIEAEIRGKWLGLRQNVPNLGLLLTGGDASRLELRDISPKFADAHLTLKGYHALFRHLQDLPSSHD